MVVGTSSTLRFYVIVLLVLHNEQITLTSSSSSSTASASWRSLSSSSSSSSLSSSSSAAAPAAPFRWRIPGRTTTKFTPDDNDDDKQYNDKSGGCFGKGTSGGKDGTTRQKQPWFVVKTTSATAREFDLFGSRDRQQKIDDSTSSSTTTRRRTVRLLDDKISRCGGTSSSSGVPRRSSGSSSQTSSSSTEDQDSTLSDWIMESVVPSIKTLPRIVCNIHPSTTIKVRKTFRPFFPTIVRLGADYNTQHGIWQFKSSWEDEIMGGMIALVGRELQLTKSWALSIGTQPPGLTALNSALSGRLRNITTSGGLLGLLRGKRSDDDGGGGDLVGSGDVSAVSTAAATYDDDGGGGDIVTRLRLRAAVDLVTLKAYARFGFHTERLTPLNIREGITMKKVIPLDWGSNHNNNNNNNNNNNKKSNDDRSSSSSSSNVKLEVKAHLRLPEPEIEFNTESSRSLIGMSDVEITIQEFNLLLDY